MQKENPRTYVTETKKIKLTTKKEGIALKCTGPENTKRQKKV
jgi:hypothetical protein